MGCLSVDLSRLGGVSVAFERIGGVVCDFSRVGFADIDMSRVGGGSVTATRTGGMKCRFSIVCSSGIMPPYLEIAPEVIWIWEDPAYNDVYSNTTWNIN